MKALKIIGYILSMLLTVIIFIVWLSIFPFSADADERLGFAIGVVIYFAIFIIASIVPFILGTVGAIISGVKHRAKGIVHFIVIALLPATMSVLMLLSAYLI